MADIIVGDIRVLKLFDSVDKVDGHREKNNFVGGLQDELPGSDYLTITLFV